MFKLNIFRDIKYLFVQKYFVSSVSGIPRIPHSKSELIESLLLLKPNSPENSKSLKISVLGCPNSGKSTLVNMLTRWKVCAVSGKINTTRTKQTVVLTQDNVQLCFIDMPGVIGRKKGFNFKLEKSLIRDPHVGIFESDLVICVVDVTHKGSHSELNVELLKALHFFKDKPSILVLNKTDKLKGSMKLFDITKKLTDGVVGGKVSHKDSYANRFRKTVPSYNELLNDSRMTKLLNKHQSQVLLGSETGEISQDNVERIAQIKDDDKIENIFADVDDQSSNREEIKDNSVISVDDHDQPSNCEEVEVINEGEKLAREEEVEVINEGEKLSREEEVEVINEGEKLSREEEVEVINEGEKLSREEEVEVEMKEIMNKIYNIDNESQIDKRDLEIDDQIMDVLKSQLMMKTATKEEVIERRMKWRQISSYLDREKETCWKHFDDVFAVSSATGHGIDRLRDYLISKSRPGSWYFHSSLITDQEPEELVRMSVWASCLGILAKEIPYNVKIEVSNYEKSADGSLHILVNINCKRSRQIMSVIGTKGCNIKAIADRSREILENCFQTDVYLKVVAKRIGIPGEHLHRMKSVNNFQDLYPKPEINQ